MHSNLGIPKREDDHRPSPPRLGPRQATSDEILGRKPPVIHAIRKRKQIPRSSERKWQPPARMSLRAESSSDDLARNAQKGLVFCAVPDYQQKQIMIHHGINLQPGVSGYQREHIEQKAHVIDSPRISNNSTRLYLNSIKRIGPRSPQYRKRKDQEISGPDIKTERRPRPMDTQG